nr:hypothetical protein CFP56_77648 [Quercus suber]
MIAAKVIFVPGFYDKSGLENDRRPGKGGHGKPVMLDSSDTVAQREENSNMETEETGEALMTNLNHDGAIQHVSGNSIMDSSKELIGNKSEEHIRDLPGGLVMTHEFGSVNMVNIPDKEKSATTTMKGNEPGGLVLFWRSTNDVIVEGSGTNYIDTMFQEEDRVGIGVIIRECQGKGLAHMVRIIPLPLIVIELETLAISKALQFNVDLSLEDVTLEGVSEIAMNALNSDSQSLQSFGLLSLYVKCFASLFHCIMFSHVHRE